MPKNVHCKLLLTPEQINYLFEQLKGNYIDENTNIEHFKAIYKNEPLPGGFEPIRRTKRFTKTSLAYFVSELFQTENPNDYWHIAEHCFNAKGLRQTFNNVYQYNKNKHPRGYEAITDILKNIYTPLQ